MLGQLEKTGLDGTASRTVAREAAARFWERYLAFSARAAEDHPEHPALVELLNAVTPSAAPEAERWGALGCRVISHLGRPDHPLALKVVDCLVRHADTFGTDELRRLAAVGRFRYANLYLFDDNARANELFTSTIECASPEWEVYGSLLNNRGITWHAFGDRTRAMQDYSMVIESRFATDEMRACSLNNRADLFDKGEGSDDLQRAIADRSAVLDLGETTFNRRYIALARRSAAWVRLGNIENALRDLDTIVSTPDIAIEQKMASRLRRAQILARDGDASLAIRDLRAILESPRNFDNVPERAAELLTTLM